MFIGNCTLLFWDNKLIKYVIKIQSDVTLKSPQILV